MKKALLIATLVLTLAFLVACGGSPATPPAAGNPSTDTPATGAPVANAPAANAPAADNPSTDAPEEIAPESDFDTSRIIAVITREDGSGTRDAFVSITGVGDDMFIEAVVETSTSGVRAAVETNPYAIGYVSVGSLNDSVRAVSIDGVYPSDETIIDGSFTLQRPLMVVVSAESYENPLVADFIAFMLSAEGQAEAASSWTPVDTNPPEYTASGLTGTIRVGGSTSVDPLMQRMREAYIAHNPGVNIEISGGGTGAGISQAREGVIDLGMSSRDLRDTEREGLRDINIALDGVAVIVNPSNPIPDFSIEQVRQIFTGEVNRWSEVG